MADQEIAVNESSATQREVDFTCVKSDDVNDFLQASDMSTFTVKISKNGGAATTPSGATCTEVDATNQKGYFKLGLAAADVDTIGRLVITITNSGGTKAMRKRVIRVRVTATDRQNVTPSASITQVNGTNIPTPTTAGVLRVDVKAMEANTVTNTAFANDALTASKVADGTIDLATFAADALLSAFGIANMGTAQSGSTSTTLKLATGASSSDDRYLNGVVLITGGTGAGQINQITDYVGATRVASVAQTWATTPDATSTYVIYAGGAASSAPSASTVATEVWAKVLEGSHTSADILRLIVSACVGMVSDFSTGTLAFRDLGNTKTRFVAVDDEDVGRTSVSIIDAT